MLRNLTKLFAYSALATLVVTACSTESVGDDDEGSAVCGDGKASGGEECDGTDFGQWSCANVGDPARPWDAGTLGCSAECKITADQCTFADDDQDGLANIDEGPAGTDPLVPDSDGDGVLDGAEVENGSDPLDMYSWPQGVGIWPDRYEISKQELSGDQTGWGLGDRLVNQQWTDQFGQTVQLHQFYGYVTVLSVGAVWCPPCNQAAATSQQLWDQHRDQGVMFIEQLNDGNQQGVDATQQDVDGWVAQYGMHFPVVWADFALFSAPSIPTFYILDRDLIVRDVIAGFPGDAGISEAINAVVAASQ